MSLFSLSFVFLLLCRNVAVAVAAAVVAAVAANFAVVVFRCCFMFVWLSCSVLSCII